MAVLRAVARVGCAVGGAAGRAVWVCGCWSANKRSSSAARACQWKDVAESRAMKASARWVEGWGFARR